MSQVTKLIPVNLITGFLGVGKTTAILHLLKQKPQEERWAVLVNEFGEVGIDHLIMENEGQDEVNILEVEGGCICCSAADGMNDKLKWMVETLKPDRILIEPTGLAHPASVLDLLKSTYFRNYVQSWATICLVNPQQLSQDRYATNGVYLDQLSLADVLVANKTDICTEEELEHFWEYAEEIYPPKLVIDRVEQAALKPEWLYLQTSDGREANHSDEHLLQDIPTIHTASLLKRFPKVGKPLMKPSASLGRFSCGWIFSSDEIFDLGALNKLIVRLYLDGKIDRAKGIFRLGEDWYLYNFVGGLPSTHYMAYRKDSRLELIGTEAMDWFAIQNQLQDCIVSNNVML